MPNESDAIRRLRSELNEVPLSDELSSRLRRLATDDKLPPVSATSVRRWWLATGTAAAVVLLVGAIAFLAPLGNSEPSASPGAGVSPGPGSSPAASTATSVGWSEHTTEVGVATKMPGPEDCGKAWTTTPTEGEVGLEPAWTESLSLSEPTPMAYLIRNSTSSALSAAPRWIIVLLQDDKIVGTVGDASLVGIEPIDVAPGHTLTREIRVPVPRSCSDPSEPLDAGSYTAVLVVTLDDGSTILITAPKRLAIAP